MSEKISAIIVDDEPLLIKTLKAILNEFCKEVVVVATANDVFEAKSKIEENIPDLVFLDINMPKVSGLDFLKLFNERSFDVIFVTAYDQFALEALKQGAIDYILKPVLSEEVRNAVNKIITKKKSFSSHKQVIFDNTKFEGNKSQKIVIQNNNRYLFIEHKDILWMEADHNYTKIHLITKKIISSAKPLKFYDDLLPKNMFFRIHKSYIINTSYIKEYLRDSKGTLVVLNDDEKLRIAQPKQSEFRNFLINRNIEG